MIGSVASRDRERATRVDTSDNIVIGTTEKEHLSSGCSDQVLSDHAGRDGVHHDDAPAARLAS